MAGLYFHIPFCRTRCIYCDFFSSVSMEKKAQYVEALCKELILQKDYLVGKPVDTIYFGGGTPSQLSVADFEKIFEQVRIFQNNTIPAREITLEANPDDISVAYLESLKRLGFNRVSLGVQSFQGNELRFLNRRHNVSSAIQAVKDCQAAGFNNISIDLMYGLPNQTLEIWKDNLRQGLSLGIQHISAYHLIYEEGTPLYKLLENAEISPVDEDLSVRMFEMMIDEFTQAGFEHYEISNFAKPGYRSQHNSSYWDGSHYLGIGASAHSYNGSERQWNAASLPIYIDAINAGKLPMESEKIDRQTAYNDYVLTRIRTMDGMDLPELARLFGEDKKTFCLQQAAKYLQNKMLVIEGNYLRLTRRGIFVSDGIMSDLMYMDES